MSLRFVTGCSPSLFLHCLVGAAWSLNLAAPRIAPTHAQQGCAGCQPPFLVPSEAYEQKVLSAMSVAAMKKNPFHNPWLRGQTQTETSLFGVGEPTHTSHTRKHVQVAEKSEGLNCDSLERQGACLSVSICIQISDSSVFSAQ